METIYFIRCYLEDYQEVTYLFKANAQVNGNQYIVVDSVCLLGSNGTTNSNVPRGFKLSKIDASENIEEAIDDYRCECNGLIDILNFQIIAIEDSLERLKEIEDELV